MLLAPLLLTALAAASKPVPAPKPAAIDFSKVAAVTENGEPVLPLTFEQVAADCAATRTVGWYYACDDPTGVLVHGLYVNASSSAALEALRRGADPLREIGSAVHTAYTPVTFSFQHNRGQLFHAIKALGTANLKSDKTSKRPALAGDAVLAELVNTVKAYTIARVRDDRAWRAVRGLAALADISGLVRKEDLHSLGGFWRAVTTTLTMTEEKSRDAVETYRALVDAASTAVLRAAAADKANVSELGRQIIDSVLLARDKRDADAKLRNTESDLNVLRSKTGADADRIKALEEEVRIQKEKAEQAAQAAEKARLDAENKAAEEAAKLAAASAPSSTTNTAGGTATTVAKTPAADASSATSASATPKTMSGTKIAVIVSVASVALLALVGGAVVYLRRRKSA